MKDEEQFIKEFSESHFYVNLVAEWFETQGIEARIRPHRLRPSSDVRMQYSDNGDMEIVLRVEVKHRKNLEFTCAEDYPYPTVLIDEVRLLEGKMDNFYAEVICSLSGDYAVIVPKYTFSKWTKVDKFNPAAHGERTYFEIDKKYCKFVKLTD